MPTQSQVTTQLSADNSQYRSVLNQTVDATGKTSAAILKKLDIRAGVTAIAAAVGFNLQSIAEGIARLAIGFSKDTEKQLEKLVDATDKAADAQERALEKLRAKKERDREEEIRESERQFELVAAARIKANEEIAEQQKRNEETVAASIERSVELDEQLWRQRVDRLPTDQKINALEKERGELLEVQKTLIKGSNDYKQMSLRIGELGNEIDRERETLAKEAANAEKKITEERQKQVDIATVGRGDRSLSDAELEKKIANLQSGISARAASNPGGVFTGLTDDILGSAEKGYLQQALAERDLRTRVRREAAFFGRDRAFANFGGDEQRFEQILRGSVTTQERFLSVAEKLERQVQAIPEALRGLKNS